MKRLRILFLVLTLLAVIAVFCYRRANTVRVETVWLQSQLIGKPLPYSVILPRGYALHTIKRQTYPVLYLLHGYGGDYSSWIANTNLTNYAADFDLIVVTPEGQEGWYTDSATIKSDRFETFLVQELIPDVERRFSAIRERRGRAIAGYSMGGYGALKFALKYPELFAFAASLSGAFDAPFRNDDASIMKTFGPSDSWFRKANTLTSIASQVAPQTLPRIYLDCGKDDPWLASNHELHTEFQRLGIEHDYRELAGNHDWSYWNRQIHDLLPITAAALAAQKN